MNILALQSPVGCITRLVGARAQFSCFFFKETAKLP